MRTSAPASAKASAMAAPRPRPPPVMTATLSSRRNLSRIIAASLFELSDETVASLAVSDSGISETGSSLAYGRRGCDGGHVGPDAAGGGWLKSPWPTASTMTASKIRRTLTLLLLASWLRGRQQ